MYNRKHLEYMQGETDIAKYFIFAERKLNNNRLKYITYESED